MSQYTGELKNLKAFAANGFDYYELKVPLGFHCGNPILPEGTIFVHDTTDHIKGSISKGCLKLCYKEDGGCFGHLCADTVILHADFIHSNMFEKVDSPKVKQLTELIDKLSKQLEQAKEELRKLNRK